MFYCIGIEFTELTCGENLLHESKLVPLVEVVSFSFIPHKLSVVFRRSRCSSYAINRVATNKHYLATRFRIFGKMPFRIFISLITVFVFLQCNPDDASEINDCTECGPYYLGEIEDYLYFKPGSW